jgi:hypothetical protein
MTREGKLWAVLVVAALGIWGCARGPGSQGAAQAERFRDLEARCGKLEEDYKVVMGDRDHARLRVAALEEQLVEHQAVVKERDALKRELEARTGERDSLQARCDRLKKGLQSLLGQDDAAAAPAAPAAPSAVAPVTAVPTGPVIDPS